MILLSYTAEKGDKIREDERMVIAICDDERAERERAGQYVEAFFAGGDAEILAYGPEEFQQALEKKQSEGTAEEENATPDWDIVIMDIEFHGRSFDGIALTRQVNEACQNCQVIYLTHILEFAPDVYETEHCYFVLKDNMEVMLKKALEKAVYLYEKRCAGKPLALTSGGYTVYVPQEEIRYVEKRQRQTVIHTGQKEYPCYESISSLQKRLADHMVRCHSGYLVNLAYVREMESDKVELDLPGVSIPVGKTFREQTKQAYLQYWMRRY